MNKWDQKGHRVNTVGAFVSIVNTYLHHYALDVSRRCALQIYLLTYVYLERQSRLSFKQLLNTGVEANRPV